MSSLQDPDYEKKIVGTQAVADVLNVIDVRAIKGRMLVRLYLF